MANQYDVGDVIRAAVVFKDINGVASDPGTIRLKLKKPDQTSTTLVYGTDGALIKDSTGTYHADFSLDLGGSHFYRWEGTGAIQAAGQGRVVAVKPYA